MRVLLVTVAAISAAVLAFTARTATLTSLEAPALGGAFHYQLDDVSPDATTGLYLIGVQALPTPVPLLAIGLQSPCSLVVNFVDIQVAIATSPGQIGSAQITIPANMPSLVDLDLYVQGVSNGSPFRAPIATSNTLRATIGSGG